MDGTGKQNDGSDRRGTKRGKFLAGDDSSKSSPSSIGTPNDSGEDEVQSNSNPRTGLDSLDSLQDSLPIKKGLSSHFDGKSKSFTDLSSANELKKQENPTNKRRRILTSSRWSRRASLCNCPDPNSVPLLPLPDEQDDDDKEEEKCGEQLASPSSSSRPRSSSLTEGKKQEDDQQHDEEEKKESDEDEEDDA